MKDLFDKTWITNNSLKIVDRYEDGVLTLRSLFYQLVSIGMTNSIQHYKRVTSAMTDARWKGLVDFEKFSDNDREMIGKTETDFTFVDVEVQRATNAITAWMKYYNKNRWENQPYYPEIFIEKKALQGVFAPICERNSIALGACKGYPSLTFLNDAAKCFVQATENGKIPIILYFGDYDPSGEDIPRSLKENIIRLGCDDIEVRRIALMEQQVIDWSLPPAPTKITDSRAANWDGLGQVELDSVEPRKLQRLCQEAIDSIFDKELYSELIEEEKTEKIEYKARVKEFVNNIE